MKKFFTILAALAFAVVANAQNVDYENLGYYRVVGEGEDANVEQLSEINIAMTEDLDITCAIVNNGPEELAAGDSLLLNVSINGMALGAAGWSYAELAEQNLLSVSLSWLASLSLFTAEQMDQYEQYIGTSFEVCFAISNVNAVDVDPSNNEACIQVNRGATGLNEIAAGEISVYPNPASTVVNVANAEGAQVSVFDMSGRMVSNIESASANEMINVSNLSKGMYIVRIVDGQNVTTKKISIAR